MSKLEKSLEEIAAALEKLNAHVGSQSDLLSGLQIALSEFHNDYKEREERRGREIQDLRRRLVVLEGGGDGRGASPEAASGTA